MPAPDPIHAAEIDGQILAGKKDGLTFQAIADQLGYSKQYVYRCYQRALRQLVEPSLAEYRARQLARIQAQRDLVEEIANGRHVVVSNGRVVSAIVGTGEDGKPIYGDPLEDVGPHLSAVDRLVKLDDQEARLLGMYPATKMQVDASVNYTVGNSVNLGTLS